MSLRKQSLIASIVGLIVMLAILYGLLYAILMHSFLSLETDNVTENVNRAVNTLSDELNHLSSTAADWAYWDDTYAFVKGTNDGFVDGNVSYDTLSNLDLDFMLYLDADGQFVLTEAIDLQAEDEVPISDWLKTYVLESSLLLDLTDLTGSVSGLLQTPDGPVLIVSRAVLTSQNEGPAAGTLVIGRYLNESRLQMLSDSLRLDIHMHDIDNFIETGISASNLNPDMPTVQPRDASTIDGYASLDDITGQPALVLHIIMPRPIYAQARATLSYVLVAFAGIGIVFASSTVMQINRIMSRLSWLSATMTRIRETGDTSIDVTLAGDDEVANLGRGLREMLNALSESRSELQRANDSLEELVDHRTAALVEANGKLKREIAERKQAQSELAQARDQAMDALRLKTQILANISHDARTPLSVIMLRARMLQSGRNGPITEMQNEKLESIVYNVQQLTGFVNNLLDGAQMESAQLRLECADVVPAELLMHLDETAGPLAERKNLSLTWAVDDNLPDEVRIDPARFNQILANLVGNAIKFTNDGGVHVRLFRPDAGHWGLEVSDTGPGIPVEAQERIFDAFWQVDGTMTREANRGVGLGLSIVKQLATLMHGEIAVQSQPGAGTTFIVTFPLEEAKKGTLVDAQVSVSG